MSQFFTEGYKFNLVNMCSFPIYVIAVTLSAIGTQFHIHIYLHAMYMYRVIGLHLQFGSNTFIFMSAATNLSILEAWDFT